MVEPENGNKSPVDYEEMNEDGVAMIEMSIACIEVEEKEKEN